VFFDHNRLMVSGMGAFKKAIVIVAASAALNGGAAWAKHDAQVSKPAIATTAPKLLGRFGHWQAAIHDEAGKPACYAFAYPDKSHPALKGRGSVVLSVTHRVGERNAVALTAGYQYPANAEPKMMVDKTVFSLYTAQSSAFARNGGAVVQAFDHAGDIAIRGPAARGDVTDHFSLKGFAKAYEAINKACPN
jgi:hypothetical protein